MFDPTQPGYAQQQQKQQPLQQQQQGQIKPPMRPRSLKASSGSSFRTLPRKQPFNEVEQLQQHQKSPSGIERSASMKSIKEDVMGAILTQLRREQTEDQRVLCLFSFFFVFSFIIWYFDFFVFISIELEIAHLSVVSRIVCHCKLMVPFLCNLYLSRAGLRPLVRIWVAASSE